MQNVENDSQLHASSREQCEHGPYLQPLGVELEPFVRAAPKNQVENAHKWPYNTHGHKYEMNPHRFESHLSRMQWIIDLQLCTRETDHK